MHILHVSLIVSDLKKAKLFYEHTLGLKPDTRPDLGFDGLFYKLGAGQQLHLMCVADPYKDCTHPTHGGRDRHIAFAVNNLEDMCKRLERAGVSYTLSKSGRAALFCYDEDGNAMELCEVMDISS